MTLARITALILLALVIAAPVAARDDAGVPLQRAIIVTRYGTFSQYSKGPTDDQIWYHTEVTGLLKAGRGYQGMIAVVSCDDVGKDAWIKVEKSKWLKVFIFDCSGHVSTTRWMTQNNILAELDWYTVEKLGLPHNVGIRGAISYRVPHTPWPVWWLRP